MQARNTERYNADIHRRVGNLDWRAFLAFDNYFTMTDVPPSSLSLNWQNVISAPLEEDLGE